MWAPRKALVDYVPMAALLLLTVASARADTILFQDAGGLAGATTTFAGDFIFCFPFTGQHCDVIETGHGPGDSIVTFGIASVTYIGNLAGIVTDQLTATPDVQGPITSIDYSFDAGLASNGTTCASVGGCQFTADGTVQILGTITWADAGMGGLMDTIEFQAVPEPGSVSFVGLGLVGLAAAFLRRFKQQRIRC
jgi:PEP-CTERM motif